MNSIHLTFLLESGKGKTSFFIFCVYPQLTLKMSLLENLYINRAMNLNCHLGEGLNFKGVSIIETVDVKG